MTTTTINGRAASLPDDPDALLIEVVRDQLKLTGTKLVCGGGVCGACTVLVDGAPVASCLMPAHAASGKSVTTVEGIGAAQLHPVQKAFMAHDALQCGFCTPGMIMTATDMINRHPEGLDEATVRAELEGNICRCTGYHNIVKAILAASETMAKGSKGKAKKAA